MRIALISDIHGNLVALEAALADIQRRGAERIICLGDVAAGGPQPREVIQRLHDLAIPVVMGNTDQWLLNPVPIDADSEEKEQEAARDQWAAAQLTAADTELVLGYQPTLSLDFGHGFTLLCYHGSPRSFNDRIEPVSYTHLDVYKRQSWPRPTACPAHGRGRPPAGCPANTC